MYSSGGDNPLWTIVKSEMTQKELENEISISSMMMNAARDAKLKIKNEDPDQLKLEFAEVSKKEISAKSKEIRLQNQLADPYYGSTIDMKYFLEDLHCHFEGQWIHVDDDRVTSILAKYNKKLGVLSHKLKKLADRHHCELKFKGKVLKQFYLKFNKNQ